LSARLKRTPGVLVATAALLIAIPALLPAHAESQNAPTYEVQVLSTVPAQDTRSTDREAVAAPEQRPKQSATREVEPGDNLWTIARERLGPDAPADLIAAETGQIFELNRDRIGQDPDRILPGQELLLTEGLPQLPEQPEVGATPAATSADSKDEHAADPSQTDSSPAASSSWTNSEPAYPTPDRAIGVRYDALALTLLSGLFLFALAIAVFGVSKLLWIRRKLRERIEPPAHEGLLIYPHDHGAYDGLNRPEQEADRHDAETPEPAIAGSRTSNVSVSSPGSEKQT
jgi:hypothetical protein